MTRSEKNSQDLFTVMTFNLRFGLAQDGPNGWQFRKKLLPGLFKDYPADFIGFQEVNRFQADDLNAMLPEYHSVGRREPAPGFWQNNIIYYKKEWKLAAHQHFYLSPTPSIPSRSRDSKWPRQCTVGVFRRQHRRLICVDTHFDFNPSVQAASAAIILDRLADLQPPAPAIVMGDFNASATGPHFEIFTGVQRNFTAEYPRFASALKQPYPATYHGFGGKPDGECIDWIFFTEDTIELLDAHVIRDDVAGPYYSDHHPVMARFRWRDS
jgi:endonuclease/exonuclease/phosphatase family metal-dependent hydrolase